MMISGKCFDFTNIPTGFIYLGIVGIIIHLLATILDEKCDKEEGTKTTAVFLGSRNTALLCLVIGAVGIILVRYNIFFVIGLVSTMVVALISIFTNFKDSTRLKILVSALGIVGTFLMGLVLLLINPGYLR
jgi:4-hydroxybenzoate polyprenyltransferase